MLSLIKLGPLKDILQTVSVTDPLWKVKHDLNLIVSFINFKVQPVNEKIA